MKKTGKQLLVREREMRLEQVMSVEMLLMIIIGTGRSYVSVYRK